MMYTPQRTTTSLPPTVCYHCQYILRLPQFPFSSQSIAITHVLVGGRTHAHNHTHTRIQNTVLPRTSNNILHGNYFSRVISRGFHTSLVILHYNYNSLSFFRVTLTLTMITSCSVMTLPFLSHVFCSSFPSPSSSLHHHHPLTLTLRCCE